MSRIQSAHHVYMELKEKILSFSLYPGTRITETELSAEYGVSRTPIREALQRLAVEGFVSIRPKQGCFVRELDIEEIDQYYQVRIALEELALRLAAEQMPRAALEMLGAQWDPAQAPQVPIPVEEMALKDESFHLQLAQCSGNNVLVELLQQVNARIHIIRRLDFTDLNRINVTYREHHQLVALLLQGDLAAALAALRSHVQYSQEFARSLTLRRLSELRRDARMSTEAQGS